MNQGKVELTRFDNDGETCVFKYKVEHNNGNTNLEQSLTIKSEFGSFNPKWVAELELEGFVPQETPADAAMKLAEWLERMAAAIKSGEYINVEVAEYKDLDK